MAVCSVLGEPNAQIKPSESIEDPSSAGFLLTRNFKPDSETYTILMKWYMQRGRLEDVLQTLRTMQIEDDSRCHPDKDLKETVIASDVATYNTLINGCIHITDN
ncbi:hypothetical protein KI387_026371, partial [Taxus chinensis]